MQGGAAKGRNYGLSQLYSAKVTKNGRVFCVYFSLSLKEKNKNVTVFVTGLCYNTTITKAVPATARTENAYRRRKYRTEKSKPRESVGRKARRLKRGISAMPVQPPVSPVRRVLFSKEKGADDRGVARLFVFLEENSHGKDPTDRKKSPA